MRKIPVVKMSGTGNDFLMIDNRAGVLTDADLPDLARAACPRRISAGADGIICLEAPLKPGFDYRMRIINADGSEAEMCGNGSRCLAVFAKLLGAAGDQQRMETMAGPVQAQVLPGAQAARVQLSQPSRMEVRRGVALPGGASDLYFINTGVPHAIKFVAAVAAVDVKVLGAAIRYHEAFKPKGTNANFVQLMGDNSIKVRTYERGVEDETLACGTGSTASAIISGLVHGYRSPVRVHTAGGDVLTIHFQKQGDELCPPFLEGAVDTIYQGEFFWRC